MDPKRLRLFSDLRIEGAASDTMSYGRIALDLTASRSLGRFALGVTGAAGTSVADLPPQRLWYLGGTHTVRGQRAGAALGNAFWLGRAEAGTSFVYARPVIFFDIGWAGSREAMAQVGRPLTGAGVGASIMDGLLRFDVAQGIHPEREVRVNLYLEGRF